MKIDGTCHCGEVKFKAEIDENSAIVCHCTDCQILSGSPYRVVVPTLVDTFKMIKGEVAEYKKISDSGDSRLQTFCPKCGTPLYSSIEIKPSRLFIRVGAIKQRAEVKPSIEIWRRSSLCNLLNLSEIEGSDEQQALVQK